MASKREDNAIYRIPPYYYIHVLDQNTNVTNIEIGPQTYIRKDNQRVTLGPEKMVVVPPRHYCVIENPVSRDEGGKPLIDRLGQIKLQHADQEIRLMQDPFPLYPGEVLKMPVSPLKVVPANAALRIRAILDFEDESGEKRTAGDEWLFEGPGTVNHRHFVIGSGFNSFLKPAFDLMAKLAALGSEKKKWESLLYRTRIKMVRFLKDTEFIAAAGLGFIFSSIALGVVSVTIVGVLYFSNCPADSAGYKVSRLIATLTKSASFALILLGAVCCCVILLELYMIVRDNKRRKRYQLLPGTGWSFFFSLKEGSGSYQDQIWVKISHLSF